MSPPRAVLASLWLLLPTGCAARPVASHAPPALPAVAGSPLIVRPYAIGPGDRLRFDAPMIPELDQLEVAVRDDGRIALPLIDQTLAAGRTAAQLGSQVQEQLRRYYLAPTVRVGVVMHQSQTWAVEAGDVRVDRPYTGRDHPDDALSVLRVRGFTTVNVLRPDESGSLQPIELGGEALEAGDVVRVRAHPHPSEVDR